MAYMRGVTLDNKIVILDEAQNATPEQMKMLLTRIGDNSKIVVTGDVKQTDRKAQDNGLIDFSILYKQFGESSYISFCKFNKHDIERHPAVKEVLDIYGDK